MAEFVGALLTVALSVHFYFSVCISPLKSASVVWTARIAVLVGSTFRTRMAPCAHVVSLRSALVFCIYASLLTWVSGILVLLLRMTIVTLTTHCERFREAISALHVNLEDLRVSVLNAL